jgi:hypothetical protein
MADVDDPQVEINIRDNELDVAIAHGELEKSFDLAAARLRESRWNEISDTIGHSLFVAGLLGDPDRFVQLLPGFERHLPRFVDQLTICRVLATGVDGPVDPREIDAVIARRAGFGAISDVVRMSMTAALFVIPEKKAEYVSTAQSIATDRGWHGILRLIDSHLS